MQPEESSTKGIPLGDHGLAELLVFVGDDMGGA
jgi:hypothetical protein